jgi:hypothetical protein
MKTCHLLQTVASLWIDSPRRLPRLLRRHVDRCAACRRAYQLETELANKLATRTPVVNEPLPSHLAARINARVRESAIEPAAAGSMAFRWAVSLAAIVACAMLLALLVPYHRDEPVVWPVADNAEPTSSTVTEPLVSISVNHSVNLYLPVLGRAVQGPLETELNLMVEDGHRLFAAAVQSCVPDPAANAFLKLVNPNHTY